MATKRNRNAINYKGKIVNIGIDVHKHSWRILGLLEGQIVMAIILSRPKHEALKKLLDRFDGNTIGVVYEAGPAGFDLYGRLTADGIDCVVNSPSERSVQWRFW